MKYRIYRPVWPVYAVALFWLIFTLVHPLYRASDYVTAILLSVVVFVVTKAIWPTMEVPVPDEEEAQPEETEEEPAVSPEKPPEKPEPAEAAASAPPPEKTEPAILEKTGPAPEKTAPETAETPGTVPDTAAPEAAENPGSAPPAEGETVASGAPVTATSCDSLPMISLTDISTSSCGTISPAILEKRDRRPVMVM